LPLSKLYKINYIKVGKNLIEKLHKVVALLENNNCHIEENRWSTDEKHKQQIIILN